MTDQHPNGRHDPRADAEAARLSAAWDALVEGRPSEVDGDGLVGLARSLTASATTVRGRPGFRIELRDTIMQSPTFTAPTPSLRSPVANGRSMRRPTPIAWLPPVRTTGMRWLGVAATLALLLATAAGGYLSGVGRPGRDRATELAAPYTGTPATSEELARATPTDEQVLSGCASLQPYLPGCQPFPSTVGRASIPALGNAGSFSADDLHVASVQMQRWQIVGGHTVAFTAPVEPLAGVGIDMVMNGAYTATFSAPTLVFDDQLRIRGLYHYLPANTSVQLESGDSVTYELGTKREVTNPFETLEGSLLQFKTILFYDGNPDPSNLGAATGVDDGSFGWTLDGDGRLPKPLDQYGQSGADVTLAYTLIFGDFPFPPPGYEDRVVIGPVDPVSGPAQTEGFVLWVSDGMG